MNSIASITAPTTVHIKKVQRRQLAPSSRGNQCSGGSPIELAFKRLFGKRLEADRVAKYCLELQRRKYTTRTVENRLTKLKSKVSTSTCSVTLWRLAVKYKLRQDSVHMMIILFAVIMSVVISENTALASQRDSIKQKNPNNLSTNLNAIPTGGGIGTSATNGNFANGNPNNNKHGGNDISNQRNNTTTVTSDYGGNYITTSATTTQSIATATMTVPSNTSSAVYNGTAQKNSGAFLSGTSMVNRNTIEMTEDTRNGPYFDKAASKNITALLGKTAYLNCRVKNLGNKTMLLQVSWVRHRDIHLLTVGRYTYTSDQRFRAIHQPQTEDWILQIKYPQHRDSGIYECQVSTTPHMSHYIHLNVVEPSTEIIGAPDLYIESGSTINLTCVILNSPEPPAYIFWNHNNAIINYDSPRGGVSVVTNKGETTTSFLLIKSARPSDSGHYQCNPSNAKPKSVTVHVLNGVSHSVSRGIPSSNAARGSSVSSNVPKSVSPSVPVNVLVHLSVYQVVYAIIGDNWHQDSKHVKHLFEWILSAIVLLATELLGKRQLRRRKCEMFYDDCGCYLNDIQLKSNASLQQQQKPTDTEHKQRIVKEILTSLFQKSNPFITVDNRGSPLLKSVYSLLGRHNFEPDIR